MLSPRQKEQGWIHYLPFCLKCVLRYEGVCGKKCWLYSKWLWRRYGKLGWLVCLVYLQENIERWHSCRSQEGTKDNLGKVWLINVEPYGRARRALAANGGWKVKENTWKRRRLQTSLYQVYQAPSKTKGQKRSTRYVCTQYDFAVNYLHGCDGISRSETEKFPFPQEIRRVLRRIWTSIATLRTNPLLLNG
jgi:hypothetical protein